MNNIELIICLVLLFMAVPDGCRKLGRPSLVFPMFVILGLVLNPLVQEEVRTMLVQAGEVGFLLLLFEVGLEIDLPRFREALRPLGYAVTWAAVQYPLVVGLARLAGADISECFLAAAALTACSIGMAYPAWQSFAGADADAKAFKLQVMVALEMMAIVVLAVETSALGHGLSWMILVKLLGIAVTIFLIARFAAHLRELFQTILDRTTHWRVHWLVLLVLAVCAVGHRLGLDAPKTAFFFGLAMSGAKHDGHSLERYIAPVSQRFLIPIFFVALGLQIDWRMLGSLTALLAFGTAGLLLGARDLLHRRWLSTGGGRDAFLLLCPNLTMVALAVKVMLAHNSAASLTAWLLLTGLFMTIASLLLLPAANPPVVQAPQVPEADSSGRDVCETDSH